MTRKQAIKEFRREGMIIPESAVELAISDMEKLEKIEQIIEKWNEVNQYEYGNALIDIQKVLEKK